MACLGISAGAIGPLGKEYEYDWKKIAIQVRPIPISCASGFATQCDRGGRRSCREARLGDRYDRLKEAAARRDPADGDKLQIYVCRQARGYRHVQL